MPGEILPADLLVLDLIYARTRLLRDAAAAGCTVADGEMMLLHQGAAAFTLWTGQPAPLEVMQRPWPRPARRASARPRASRRRSPTRAASRRRWRRSGGEGAAELPDDGPGAAGS